MRATTALDQLMAEWFDDPKPFPIGARGFFPDENDLIWYCQFTGKTRLIDEVDAATIRVSVFDRSDASRPLIFVDLIQQVPSPNQQ